MRSGNPEDVKEAVVHGYLAGCIYPTDYVDDEDDKELRLAFDFDGVIADDSAEFLIQHYKKKNRGVSVYKIKAYHYDAFSNIPNRGNPAGVVLDGDILTEEQMQEVAEQIGFNETAFPLKSEIADLRIRFFTPGHEMNLCGHATMAAVYALKTKGLLGDKTEFTIETKAGVLPVRLHSNNGLNISMMQAAPQFQEFNGSLQELASSIGIDEGDIVADLPVLYGYTGTWTLLIPIKGLAAYDPCAHMHARHFSSPFSGTIEDPVTGTASGVMGAYYARYIKSDHLLNLVIEQGQEIGRDGRIGVTVTNGDRIEITGTAVYVKELDISVGGDYIHG
jgi:predicted PhzF superfamily epimerase YddE/YHI9